eukprot:4782406-Ditylum_brightwellii.AAC.1
MVSLAQLDIDGVWGTVDEVPKDEEFLMTLKARQMEGRNNNKVSVYCKLVTYKKKGDLKYHEVVINYIKKKKIFINMDCFNCKEVASPGFIINLLPKITRKDDLVAYFNVDLEN